METPGKKRELIYDALAVAAILAMIVGFTLAAIFHPRPEEKTVDQTYQSMMEAASHNCGKQGIDLGYRRSAEFRDAVEPELERDFSSAVKMHNTTVKFHGEMSGYPSVIDLSGIDTSDWCTVGEQIARLPRTP